MDINGGAGGSFSQISYQYDANGNVTRRADDVMGLEETFSYDALNRIENYYLNGGLKTSVSYDGLGNITSKTGVGSYSYGGSRPHAVTAAGSATFDYDANGNMTRRDLTDITWSSYNKPVSIDKGSDSLSFNYGPNRNRVKQVATIGGNSVVTHYAGLMEVVGIGAAKNFRHRIVAGGGVVAQHSRTTSGTVKTTYMASDALGSINVLTDESGALVDRMHFDPWGKRVDADDWDGDASQAEIDAIRDLTHRGFTDHEMLDGMGMIHMNGRVYDPNLGRMLSADPVNSQPFNLQRYDRYSYVNNNPLGYTDPSGFDGCDRHASKCLRGATVVTYQLCVDDYCAADGYYEDVAETGGRSGEMQAVAAQVANIEANYSSNSYYGFGGSSGGASGLSGSDDSLLLPRFQVSHSNLVQTLRQFARSIIYSAMNDLANLFGYRSGARGGSEAAWPTDHHGQVTRGYSSESVVHPVTGQSRPHTAVDMVNPEGDSVYAMWDGEVIDVGYTDGSGNYLYLQHDNGYSTGYSHTGTALNVGDTVLQGQQIGISNGSGLGTAPHLHLVLREGGRNGRRIDACTVLAEC